MLWWGLFGWLVGGFVGGWFGGWVGGGRAQAGGYLKKNRDS